MTKLTTTSLLDVIEHRTEIVKNSLDNNLPTLDADISSLKAAVNLIDKVRHDELGRGVNTAKTNP